MPDKTIVNISSGKKDTKYASITYVPELTEELCKQLKYFAPDVKIASSPPDKMVKFYSKLKQPIEKGDLTGVVYKIPCKESDTEYIEETIQKVCTRIGQHGNDCSTVNLAKKSKKRTALATHAKETGHRFDFDLENVQILKRERNKSKLKVQEVNQIIMHEGETCNFKSDSAVIGPAYGNLLKQFKLASVKRFDKNHPPRTDHINRKHIQHGFVLTSHRSSKK